MKGNISEEASDELLALINMDILNYTKSTNNIFFLVEFLFCIT